MWSPGSEPSHVPRLTQVRRLSPEHELPSKLGQSQGVQNPRALLEPSLQHTASVCLTDWGAGWCRERASRGVVIASVGDEEKAVTSSGWRSWDILVLGVKLNT